MPKVSKEYIVKCLTTSNPSSYAGLSDWGVKYRDGQKIWESYRLDTDSDKSIKRWVDINAVHFEVDEWNKNCRSTNPNFWYEVEELTDNFGRQKHWMQQVAEDIRMEEDLKVLEILDQAAQPLDEEAAEWKTQAWHEAKYGK